MAHPIGDVARLSRVSVRTLRHYDEIGLLRPSKRTDAGYRLYTDADLERLQQVLFYRELGFSLGDVAKALDDPAFDRRDALLAHRALLVEKGERLRDALALVDKTLESLEKGISMKPEELFEVFGDFDVKAAEEEAAARWGDTPHHAESMRRTKRYTKEDWKTIRAEGEAIADELAALLDSGAAPDDPRATELAERARLHIDRWFYPCSRRMHATLGEMYVSDARFAAYYDGRRAGLARFVRDAIAANLARR